MKFTLKQAPAYSIAHKYKLNKQDQTPAPNQYSPNFKFQSHNKHQPEITFTKSLRQSNKKQIRPGPGQYNINSTLLSRGLVIPKCQYRQEKQILPGPSNYNAEILKIKRKNPSYTMSSKIKYAGNNNAFVGPGSYQIQKFKIKPQKNNFSIGRQRKFASQSKFRTPGPGSYLKNYDNYNHILFKQSPKIMFIKSKKNIEISRDLPGRNKLQQANQYEKISEFDQNIKKKKGFSINQDRNNLNILNMYPGPGQQQKQLISNPSFVNFLKKKAPTLIFGNCKRIQLIKSNTPSPGQYDIFNYKTQRGPCFSFPSQRRDIIFAKNNQPGPCNYVPDKIQCTLPTQPKYSFPKSHSTQTFNQKIRFTNTFYYQKTNNMNNRGYKIGTSLRTKFVRNAYTPGVGSYNPRELQKGPKWKFTEENRLENKIKITPGPADYNLGHLFIGQLQK